MCLASSEFGWTRARALEVVPILADRELAVLGGESWVLDGAREWNGVTPQQHGPSLTLWTDGKQREALANPGQCL